MSLYSESSNSSIYHCLEKANAENKNYTKNTEDEKSFRESLYADWLESLRKIPKEEIQKSGKAFYVMGEYALSHPEVKTRQQLTELIDSNQSFNSKQKEVLIDLVDDKCYNHASSIG